MTRRGRLGVGAALVAIAVGAVPAVAQQSSAELERLRQELSALKEGQAAILKELQDLRTLLLGASRAAARGGGGRADTVQGLDGAPFLGQARAPVTLVEFTDYQCPFCAQYMRETFPQIERDYIKTGKVRYVMRDFPIVGLHPQAFKGHEAARCAGDQGKRWEMHRRLFADQKAMGPTELEAHAQAIGLDLAKFRDCVRAEKYAAAIRKDLEEGNRVGVNGTPTFLLGRTEPSATAMKVSQIMSGAQPYERFKEAIDGLLQASGAATAPAPADSTKK